MNYSFLEMWKPPVHLLSLFLKKIDDNKLVSQSWKSLALCGDQSSEKY